jgi:predicted site-specific integrase-resolvase
MKLREYAKQNSISYQTAWNHFKAGLIPNATKTATGQIVVPEKFNQATKTALYARVSSPENRDNLDSQLLRLRSYASALGHTVDFEIKEIGSGLNDSRPKLIKLLSDLTVKIIIVEHKDRLTRFGFNYIQTLLRAQDREILVINQTDSDSYDLMQDFTSIITSFCARIYGLRRSQRKTEKLIAELSND